MDFSRKHWVLIQRYVTGNSDLRERRIIDRWKERYPENEKLIQEIQEIWELSTAEDFKVDSQKAWEKFQTRNQIQSNRVVTRKASKVPLYLLRVAALLLVTAFAVVFTKYTLTNDTETEQVSDFYVMQTFETDKGEKASVTFTDGTSVILNSSSSIRFPKEFHGSKREVYLEGEAYFEVAHDPDHPFIVYNQEVEIEVLGTQFNVQGWHGDSAVAVAVRNGKVAVGSSQSNVNGGDDKVVLTEGLFTSINKGESPSPPRNVDITNYIMWTRGGLHFDNVEFSRVVRDLERRFNIHVEGLDDELKTVPYTGTFLYADLDEVLSVIGTAMEFEYERDGRVVSINN